MIRTILPGLAQAVVMNSAEGSLETSKEHLQVRSPLCLVFSRSYMST